MPAMSVTIRLDICVRRSSSYTVYSAPENKEMHLSYLSAFGTTGLLFIIVKRRTDPDSISDERTAL